MFTADQIRIIAMRLFDADKIESYRASAWESDTYILKVNNTTWVAFGFDAEEDLEALGIDLEEGEKSLTYTVYDRDPEGEDEAEAITTHGFNVTTADQATAKLIESLNLYQSLWNQARHPNVTAELEALPAGTAVNWGDATAMIACKDSDGYWYVSGCMGQLSSAEFADYMDGSQEWYALPLLNEKNNPTT